MIVGKTIALKVFYIALLNTSEEGGDFESISNVAVNMIQSIAASHWTFFSLFADG